MLFNSWFQPSCFYASELVIAMTSGITDGNFFKSLWNICFIIHTFPLQQSNTDCLSDVFPVGLHFSLNKVHISFAIYFFKFNLLNEKSIYSLTTLAAAICGNRGALHPPQCFANTVFSYPHQESRCWPNRNARWNHRHHCYDCPVSPQTGTQSRYIYSVMTNTKPLWTCNKR